MSGIDHLTNLIHRLEQGRVQIGCPGNQGQGHDRLVQYVMIRPLDTLNEIDFITSLGRFRNNDLLRGCIDGK